MVLETAQNKESEVVTEAKQLVTKLEPHIKVQEEKKYQSGKRSVYIRRFRLRELCDED